MQQYSQASRNVEKIEYQENHSNKNRINRKWCNRIKNTIFAVMDKIQISSLYDIELVPILKSNNRITNDQQRVVLKTFEPNNSLL